MIGVVFYHRRLYIYQIVAIVTSRQVKPSNSGNEESYNHKRTLFREHHGTHTSVPMLRRLLKCNTVAPINILQLFCGEEIHARWAYLLARPFARVR